MRAALRIGPGSLWTTAVRGPRKRAGLAVSLLSVGKALDVRLALASEIGHVAARDPDRVADAALPPVQPLEFRIHHPALLRGEDGRPDRVTVEGVADALVGLPERQVQRFALRQEAGVDRPER
jgi:hypothetical protein